MRIINIIKKESKIGEFLRFILVGGIATGIHYGIYLIVYTLGISFTISYTLGYGISFIFNYIASNYFTFKTNPNTKSGVKFVGAHCCNYLLQLILLNIYIYIGISQVIAPIGVFVVAIPINFILVRIALKSSNKK